MSLNISKNRFFTWLFLNWSLLTYLKIIGHWIDDDWNLHEALLDFRHVESHHTKVILTEHVFEILEEYEICEKLFCITTNDATNNGTLYQHLSHILKHEKNIYWDATRNHIYCINHVINLVIQEFFKNIKELMKSNEINVKQIHENNEFTAEEFVIAMLKIKTIIKIHFKFCKNFILLKSWSLLCYFFKLCWQTENCFEQHSYGTFQRMLSILQNYLIETDLWCCYSMRLSIQDAVKSNISSQSNRQFCSSLERRQ